MVCELGYKLAAMCMAFCFGNVNARGMILKVATAVIIITCSVQSAYSEGLERVVVTEFVIKSLSIMIICNFMHTCPYIPGSYICVGRRRILNSADCWLSTDTDPPPGYTLDHHK